MTSTLPISGRVQVAVQTLLAWYDESTGLFATTGWWNNANIITTLAEFLTFDSSLDDQIRPIFLNTFAKNSSKGFINDYYDDEAWWALAWIKVYNLTNQNHYLSTAAAIFEDMTGGWGGPCGGVWWRKLTDPPRYTGAIENELFLALAAQLAILVPTKRKYYIDWALKQWSWFLSTGMINNDYNINNGIDATTCKNDGGTVWTYNQGVILGALIDLNTTAPDPFYMDTTARIALAAITTLTNAQGILREPMDILDVDQVQFKGIFMRNLRRLHCLQPRDEYKLLIETNARAIWENRAVGDKIGSNWAIRAEADEVTAATQSCGTDALIAATVIDG